MQTRTNLEFAPKPIDAVAIRLGDGRNFHIAIGTVQRIAALRAYNSFAAGRDWIDKVSSAYIVAIATRSADTLLMKFIQDDLSENIKIDCVKCREASIGTPIIRERLFPTLKRLREHANTLIHHLDKPESFGVAELNIQGIFEYCHHLFHHNIDALFGVIPSPVGRFTPIKCKACRKV
jgi:hypothetical protein